MSCHVGVRAENEAEMKAQLGKINRTLSFYGRNVILNFPFSCLSALDPNAANIHQRLQPESERRKTETSSHTTNPIKIHKV